MDIKEYKNKSSVLKPHSRYVQGGDTVVYKKRLGWWEQDLEIERGDVTDIEITISSRYLNRPDLIAYDYYNNALLAWVVLQYNDIIDVKEELTLGKTITIPSKSRVYYDILTKSTKTQESKM